MCARLLSDFEIMTQTTGSGLDAWLQADPSSPQNPVLPRDDLRCGRNECVERLPKWTNTVAARDIQETTELSARYRQQDHDCEVSRLDDGCRVVELARF